MDAGASSMDGFMRLPEGPGQDFRRTGLNQQRTSRRQACPRATLSRQDWIMLVLSRKAWANSGSAAVRMNSA